MIVVQLTTKEVEVLDSLLRTEFWRRSTSDETSVLYATIRHALAVAGEAAGNN